MVDMNKHKHARLVGGSHYPIFDPIKLVEDLPYHVLLLAWNFAAEIMRRQEQYRLQGGKFVGLNPQTLVV